MNISMGLMLKAWRLIYFAKADYIDPMLYKIIWLILITYSNMTQAIKTDKIPNLTFSTVINL